jgi:hypothetical protein
MWGVRSVNVVDSVRREREKKVDGISDFCVSVSVMTGDFI